MAQFDNNIKIPVILNDIESIRGALRKYQELLDTNEAVSEQVHQVEFVKEKSGEIVALQYADGDIDLLKSLNLVGTSSGKPLEIKLNDTESEQILFSHALMHEDLVKEVIDTARAIVAYARRHNDTWEMWMDDNRVFGIEALRVLVHKHPDYAYFLSSYLIPYWDSEHADYAMHYLYKVFSDHAFSDIALKMFCYCDNSEARRVMLGGDLYDDSDMFDLDGYFQKNPDRYQRFKEIMLERFEKQKFMQYTERDHTERPIHEFYESIMLTNRKNAGNYDLWDEPASGMEQDFMNSTYDNEATLLQAAIEKALGQPLTEPYVDPYESYNDDTDHVDAFDKFEEFFPEAFENGEAIWEYILKGTNPESIENLDKSSYQEKAKEKRHAIASDFDSAKNDYGRPEECFDSLLEEFMTYTYEEVSSSGMVIEIDGVDVSGKDTVLRAADVIQRLKGELMLNPSVYETFIEERLLTHEAFSARYDALGYTGFKTFKKHLEEAIDIFEKPNGNFMTRAYNTMNRNRDCVFENLSQVKDNSKGALAFMLFALNKDKTRGVGDKLTEAMFKYVDKNWLPVLKIILQQDNSLSKKDINSVIQYIEGPKMPPQELMIKVMKVGIQGLTEDEKAVIESAKSGQVDEQTALDILKSKLKVYTRKRNEPTEYMILSSNDDTLSIPLPCMYYSISKLPLPFAPAMKRALKLFLSLAPVKVIKMVRDMIHHVYDNKMEEVNALYDMDQDLKKIGAKQYHFIALDIVSRDEDRIDAHVDAYIEDDQSGGIFGGPSRNDIDMALNEIPSYVAERFIDSVLVKDGASACTYYEKAYHKYLNEFVLESIASEMSFVKNIIMKYDAFDTLQWSELTDEQKDELIAKDTGLSDEDYKIDEAYRELYEDAFIIFEISGETSTQLTGHNLLRMIQKASRDTSNLDTMLDTVRFVFLPEGTLSESDRSELQKSKADKTLDVCQVLNTYILDNENEDLATAAFKTLVRPRGYENFRKSTLFLAEDQHQRFMSLVLPLGQDGIELAHRSEIESHLEFAKRLKSLGVNAGLILHWLVEDADNDDVSLYLEQNDCSFIKDWSLSARLEILEYLSDCGDHVVLLSQLASDPSIRVREHVQSLFESHEAEHFSGYGSQLPFIYENSTPEGQQLIKSALSPHKDALTNNGELWVNEIA